MWHFEFIEFGGAKPKYLESYLMQLLVKSALAAGKYHHSDAAIASCLAPAVNGTKASKKRMLRPPAFLPRTCQINR